MATTTNYGWTTPDNTALVKDGASAIRSLGTAIDSTVFTNAGAAINKTIIDAAGDLIYGTAADTAARLAIGTAGQLLAVNSGATAPEWVAAPSSGGMTLISTTTLSGASVTLTSIPQTYVNLVLIVRSFRPTNDNYPMQMRFNADSGSNRHKGDITPSSNNSTTAYDDTVININGSADNTVAESLTSLTIPDYTNATTRKFCIIEGFSIDNATTTSIRPFNATGYYNQTGAITSLEFRPMGGGGEFCWWFSITLRS